MPVGSAVVQHLFTAAIQVVVKRCNASTLVKEDYVEVMHRSEVSTMGLRETSSKNKDYAK